MSTPTCHACGEVITGPYCRACGAATGAQACRQCGHVSPAGSRFCPECGTPAGSAELPSARRFPVGLPVLVGSLLVLLGVVLVARARRPGEAAATGQVQVATPGTPPDISNMSPRERFDRLYNRSMQAVESGDASTFGTFAPMALLAYGQLDTVDADARYHAAMLKLHTGDVPGAASLADSILATSPGHLFGYVTEVAVARWQKDTVALRNAERQFLAHYAAETAAARPEYGEHQNILDATRTAAEKDVGSGGK